MQSIYAQLLQYNRNPEISEWFKQQFEVLKNNGFYPTSAYDLCANIVDELTRYRKQHKISQVFLGMSGGIDSATTAALFKQAGYHVHALLLPLEQKIAETQRGVEACDCLKIEYRIIDLTTMYEQVKENFSEVDPFIHLNTDREAKRRGNLKARLRMIALYNLAANNGGFVASTDNFSELAAGFWTLHGDVGDVAPIQSLTKSWEVPLIAEELGVPKSILNAVPTDGLGISNSDEDQLGVSYAEFDIALLGLISGLITNTTAMSTADKRKMQIIQSRLVASAYKRKNPYNIDHPFFKDRFGRLNALDDLDYLDEKVIAFPNIKASLT
jgi:NAD+ synthetase